MSPLDYQNNNEQTANAVPPSPPSPGAQPGRVSFLPAVHYGMEQEGAVSTDQEAFDLLKNIFNQGEDDLEKLKRVEGKLFFLLKKQSEHKDDAFSDTIKNGIKEEKRFLKDMKNKEKLLLDKLFEMGTSHKGIMDNIMMDGASMHKALKTQIEHQSAVHEELLDRLYSTGEGMNGRLVEKEIFFRKKLEVMRAEHEKNILDLHQNSQELIQDAALQHTAQVERLQKQMKDSNDRWAKKLQDTIQAYEERLLVLHQGTLNTANDFGEHHSKVMQEYEDDQKIKNERFGQQMIDLQSRHEAEIAKIYAVNHQQMADQTEEHTQAMERVMKEHKQRLLAMNQQLKSQHDYSMSQKAIEAEKIKIQEKESAVLDQINKLYPNDNNLVQAQSVSIDDLPHTSSVQSTDSNPSMATWQIATIASVAGIFGLIVLMLGLYKCCAARKRRREANDRRVIVSSAGTSGDIKVENSLNKKLPLSPDDIMAIEIASEEMDDKKNQIVNNSHSLNVNEIEHV